MSAEPPPEQEPSEWQAVDFPGRLGKRRGSTYERWDERYGRGNWRLAWEFGTESLSPTLVYVQFENAYLRFLDENRSILTWLENEAGDVYDDATSNIASGRDYTVQETVRNHIHDIAIRNALFRLGHGLKGTERIQIRDRFATEPIHPLSFELSPGKVPFHRPELIRPEPVDPDPWWEPGSVEDWYQSNKALQVRRSKF